MLKTPFLLQKVFDIESVVICCLLLHNLCVDFNTPEEEKNFIEVEEEEQVVEENSTYDHLEFMNFLQDNIVDQTFTTSGLEACSKKEHTNLHKALLEHCKNIM